VRRELLGGLSTFMTMAYIIVVNPQILAAAGIPPTACCSPLHFRRGRPRSSWACTRNYPIALAPGCL